MAILTGPNLGLKYNWDLGTIWKTDGDNNLKLLDMLAKLGVIDKDLVAQPGSPINGDRYILTGSATGTDWAGHDYEIAVYIEAVWEFHTPQLGWTAFVQDENQVYYYNGTTWSILVTQTAISTAVTTLPSTGTMTMDLSGTVRNYTSTLTADGTLAFSNIPASVVTEVAVQIKQDGTGGHTLSFPAGTVWANTAPPAPSIGANDIDVYAFYIDGNGLIHGNTVGLDYG